MLFYLLLMLLLLFSVDVVSDFGVVTSSRMELSFFGWILWVPPPIGMLILCNAQGTFWCIVERKRVHFDVMLGWCWKDKSSFQPNSEGYVYIYIYIYNEMHMHTTISHTFQYPYMTCSFCPKISSLLNHSQHCAVHASYIHLFGFPFLSNLVNGALTIWCSTEHNGFLRGGQFNWQSFWRIGAHQPCHRGSPLNASKWWWQFKLKIALLSISAWTCGIASYMTSVGDVLHHAVVMWLCLKVDHGLNCH